MKVFCIFSDERAFRSKSPAVFSHVLKQIGIRSTYVPFKVYPEDLGAAMQSIKVLNIDGANITVPYKEAVLPHMDVLSEGAKIVGAVNTVIRSNNTLKGYNTNAIGFMHTLEEAGFEVSDKNALVFGTGGAARAVIFVLNWLRANSVMVAGRTPEKTQRIVDKFGGEPIEIASIGGRPVSADIVINATSVSSPEESPDMAEVVSKLNLTDCELIMDLNYGRNESFWHNLARSKEIRFISGLTPLAHSARQTILLWTRVDAGPEAFMKAVENVIY
ncbi:MAG: shikimate dehydrogenase [Desulfobacteraceae bacterium]